MLLLRRLEVFVFALWACLLAKNNVHAQQLPESVGAATEGETFNLEFYYGFFDGIVPDGPSPAEVSTLMCITQDWLAGAFQNATNNPFLTIKFWNINWFVGPSGPENTYNISFTVAGDVNTIDDSAVPSQTVLVGALEQLQAVERVESYIKDDIWVGVDDGTFFENVDQAGFEGEFGPPATEAQLLEADCNATLPPLEGNATNPPVDFADTGTGNETDGDPDGSGAGDPDGSGAGDPEGPVTNVTSPPDLPGDVTGDETAEPGDGDGDGDGGSSTTAAPSVIYGIPGENVTQNGTYPPEWGGTIPPAWGGTLPPGDTFPPTPAPVGGIDVEDDEFATGTEEMVYHTIQYGLEDGTERREPTPEEVSNLVCRTTLFFRDRVRNATNDTSVQSQGMYLDWSYNEDAEQPITVNFASNNTFYGTGGAVPPTVVFDALEVSPEEIESYIENYLLDGLDEGSIFQNAVSANFTNAIGEPVPIGQVNMADCPATPAPSAMPSISPAPTTSAAPSMMPSISNAPSVSSAPSLAPSISHEPSVSQAPTTIAENPNGGVSTPPPTSSGAALPGGPGGPPALRPVSVGFIVSNLDDIINPDQVNSSGLSVSWGPFVQQTVNRISAQREQQQTSETRRMLRAWRRLAVAVETGAAYISSIARRECPPNTHPELTCHDVTGSYVLQLVNESNLDGLVANYTAATDTAIYEDYYGIMKGEYPETPLYIGTLPPPAPTTDRGGDDDDGLPIWAIILIVLLVVLCCLCCIGLLALFLMKDRNQDKELEPYDEEGFVYDFLIPKNEKPQTEVDDDAATKDVEEEFEDEDGEAANKGIDDDQVVMVMPEDVDDFEDEPLDEIKEEGEFESDEGGGDWQDGDDEERLALPAPEPATDDDLEPVAEEGEAPAETSESEKEASESAKEVSETDDMVPIDNELEDSWKDEDEIEKAAEPEPTPEDEETTQGGETETDTEPAETFKDEAEESDAEQKETEEVSEKEAEADEEAEAEEWDEENESGEEAFEEGDKEDKDQGEGWDEDGDSDSDSEDEGWDDEASK